MQYEKPVKYEKTVQYDEPSDPNILSQTKDDQSGKVQFQTTQSYANDLVDYENISEEQICTIFGLNIDQLRTSFQPIIKHLCIIFYFLKTGEILSNDTNIKELADLFETTGLEKVLNVSGILDLKFMLKMLTVIFDNLQGGLFFSTNNVLKIPYVMDGREAVKINYCEENQSFQILSRKIIEIKPFESTRIGLNFSHLLDQFVIFEQNENLTSLNCDMEHQNPSHYQYTNMILHNFSNQVLILY